MVKKADRSKEGVIARLVETRRQILAASLNIPEEQQNQPFVGVWSIKDLLAHLAGWDYTNLGGVQALMAEEVPGFLAQHDRDWKTYNSMLVARYRCDDLMGMVEVVRAAQNELITYLNQLTDEDFRRVVHVNTFRMSIAGLLNFEIRDEQEHLAQIQKFLLASAVRDG